MDNNVRRLYTERDLTLLRAVNRLNLVKSKLHPLRRHEVEDMVYRLRIGSPVDFASRMYIMELYRNTFL